MTTNNPLPPPAAANTADAATTTAQPDTPERWQDCVPCRVTGAATFTGIGAYALYTAHQQGAFARVRPAGSPVVAGKITAAIGVVFIGLGIGRFFVK